MARVMFTDKFVRGVKSAAPGHRDTYWDALVPTFGLRVTDRGVKSYFIMTHLLLPGRNASTQVRRVVGRAALMPLATARKKAREWLELIGQGIDPKVHGRDRRITDKWLSFAERGISPHCFLYRHYDAKGDLLYVGMSLHVWSRQTRHLHRAEWANTIYQIVIEPFATREELLEAETL